MATSTPADTVITSCEERTWRANLETPRGGVYTIQVYRQTTQLDADGNAVGEPMLSTKAVTRAVPSILRQTVKLPTGEVVSAATIVAALPLFFDRWAAEDAGTPMPAPLPS